MLCIYVDCSVDIGECEHECLDTTEGYKCRCKEGYNFKDDGKSCGGE